MHKLGILVIASTAWAADAIPDRIRAAAGKAVALVQSSQKSWYSKQSCASCHQQTFPALAFRAAREHGIPVDEAAAHADAAQGLGLFSNLDRAVQYTHVIDPALDTGYQLLAADAVRIRPSIVTAVYARHIAEHQQSDGRWITGDVRPPQSNSEFTATAVSLRAIQIYGRDSKARIERAAKWLASRQPADTEDRTYQLLGLIWGGAPRAQVEKIAADLKATQQSDGGWISRAGLSSDAYSTGEALVALHEAGVAGTDAAWKRGIAYLLSTQLPDGSWHVVSRLKPPAPVSPPYFESGFPHGHDQFISTMGSCWAIMALAHAAGPAVKAEPATLAEAVPQGVEPWVETVLFGSAADVRALLDKKFDPNSATKSGGTTALMLAMPDIEKAKLLIDRGAKVNVRAKSKFSALMVAAQYPNSAATINFLLDRGAEVKMPKGAGAPMFNASPLFLAAFSQNASVIKRLRDAGDDPNVKMMMIGMFPETPLLAVAPWGTVAEARALLDAGATVDLADDDGLTPLEWSVLANRPELARLLIERGANVNHVDKKGMTALLYAASIDYADDALVKLLLKSGANPAAKTKEGLTAADLAKKYKHVQIASALGGPTR